MVAAKAQGDGLAVGVAPAATIVDLPVYRSVADSTTGGPGSGIQVPDVVAALDWLAQNARKERIGVVVIALQLDGTPQLKAAVHRLAAPANDVVIVAASGNRPSEAEGSSAPFAGEPKPGEDARHVVFPAGYTKDVLAVTSTGAGLGAQGGLFPDPTGTVLYNSATDLALPTVGAVAVDGIGTTCVLTDAQTSWAAGLAGGVVAMVRSAFPKETAAQIETRLLETADGRFGQTDRLYGAGTVQPIEALTRVMEMTKAGQLEATTSEDRFVPTVRAPEPTPDPLAGIRHDSVWWGLIGGAALVITALVRPVLARRRRTS
jgi:membrane-anchored mycosin MYCP